MQIDEKMSWALADSDKADFFGDKGFSCLQISRFLQRLFSAQPSFCSPEYSVVSTVHWKQPQTDKRGALLKNVTFYITFDCKSRLPMGVTSTFISLQYPSGCAV